MVAETEKIMLPVMLEVQIPEVVVEAVVVQPHISTVVQAAQVSSSSRSINKRSHERQENTKVLWNRHGDAHASSQCQVGNNQ
jgi:hypothetical protein